MPIQQKVWKIGAVVGVLLAVYLFTLSISQLKSIGYIGSGIQPTNTISVDGTGDAYAIPDIATFSFTVTDTEKVVADAQAKVTDKMNAAKKSLSSQGIADKDVQTTYYSINPHYEYQNAVCPQATSVLISGNVGAPVYCPPGKQTITGYDVSESVSVKLHDTSKAGTLLASLGSLNVDNLSGPSFDVDNPDSVQAQARATAIADAQAKANTLAGQLGVHLVRIVSFTENNNSSYPRPIMYAAGVASDSAKAAPVPEISAGQQKVTDNVTITYEIQ